MLFGFNSSNTLNSTTVLTNVVLSKNNFKVVGKTKGTASNWYLFLLFGGMRRRLLGRAYQNMLDEAKLEGTSRAVINVTYDWHTRFILWVYGDITITVYGTVIEFID
jgi:hypothetical protein